MAAIGFLPTKTSVQVREPDGDCGDIPAASAAAAGVMTARHVQMLEELMRWYQTAQGGGAPVVIERSDPNVTFQVQALRQALEAMQRGHATPLQIDTSQFLTKLEARQLLIGAARPIVDVTPEVQAIKAEIATLKALPAQAAQDTGPAVDQVARNVLEQMLEQYEHLDRRVASLESTINALRQIAEVKSAEAA